MENNFENLIHNILKHLIIRNEFFGKYMSNFQYFENTIIKQPVDYLVDELGYVKCYVNTNYSKENIIDALKHVATHLIVDPIPEIEPVSEYQKYCANQSFDATTESRYWHGLPLCKPTSYYYKRMIDPDYKEAGERSLRELDPSFVLLLEQVKSNPEKYRDQINWHLQWLSLQGMPKPVLSVEIRQFAKEKLKMVAETTAKSAGTLPAGLSEFFVFKKEPAKFKWQNLVRKHLGSNPAETFRSTHRKESTRYVGGAGHTREKNPSILVILDTSGSINRKEFQEFFREIDTMHKRNYDISIAEFDGNFENVYKYDRKNNKIEVHGRGGTNLKVMVDYWNLHYKEVAAGILFTDGEDDIKDIAKPRGNFMWVISSEGYQEDVYPGKTLFIPKDNN